MLNLSHQAKLSAPPAMAHTLVVVVGTAAVLLAAIVLLALFAVTAGPPTTYGLPQPGL